MEEDIPSIVALLKLSLGESRMPKSEKFWRWKHVDNPFGPSAVLLAFDRELLVGVRAFMRWQWRVDGQLVSAVRAVDTATHPKYQGRGIFTRLTRNIIEQCEGEGVGFIFNTPNEKSKPGYLKMGWKSLGKLRVFCAPRLSFSRADEDTSVVAIGRDKVQKHIAAVRDDGMATTNYTFEYLKWRYDDSPNASYKVIHDEGHNWMLIYRTKPLIIGNELRIVDFFAADRPTAFRSALTRLGGVGASLVTISGFRPDRFVGVNFGPEVTVRKLAMTPFTFQAWKPSLGDLELF